jgi:hypothetical protein
MNIQTRFTQITTAEGCVGKTIEAAIEHCGNIGFRFADGTYFYCEAWPEGDDDASLCTDRLPDDGALVELGLKSKAEWMREMEAKADRAVAERESAERKEYERLRAKFEGREGKKADDPGS